MAWNRRYGTWVAVRVVATAAGVSALAAVIWLMLPPPQRATPVACAAGDTSAADAAFDTSAAGAVSDTSGAGAVSATSTARDAHRKPRALSVADLRAAVLRRHAVTRNLPQYGLVSADTTVILVQVHRDVTSLRRLVDSLSRVHYIESTLLIFSHAHYDDGINESVDSVDFCRTMQLFYPYSLRSNPEEPSGAGESKLHWWWQAHYVFAEVGGAAGGAPVLFLHERHVVAPDALHMLRHARRALAAFPSAHVLALGHPGRPSARRRLEPDLLALDAWRPPYDVGLAFNRTTWSKIAALAIRFCMYEDCSWSYSLLNVFAAFPRGRADMLACVAPRVAARASPLWPRPFPPRVRAVYSWAAHARRSEPPAPAADCARLQDQLFCLDPLVDVDIGGGGADDSDADVYFNETSMPENSAVVTL